MIKVTAAILKNEQGEILICQRGADGSCAFLWEFPGGKIEAGETPEKCLIRECREELQIDILIDGIFAETTYSHENKKIAFTFFNGRIVAGSPIISVHVDMKWVQIAALSQYEFCPADVEIVKRIQM